MNRSHDNLPPEFEGIGRLLEQERAQLSAIELDSVKRRVMSRNSAGASSPKKGNFMKSRLAIIATLAVGLLMSGTGATLAIDGLQTAQNAAAGQYGDGEKGAVLGDNGSAGDRVPSMPATPAVGNVKSGEAARDLPEAAQPTRQVELGAPIARLPFTGYAGVTVLLFGLVLLASGLVLRSRTRQQ